MNYKLKIKQFRESKKYTQKQLASEINISQSFLSEVECNKYDIKLSLLGEISKVLETAPFDLVEYITEEQENNT